MIEQEERREFDAAAAKVFASWTTPPAIDGRIIEAAWQLWLIRADLAESEPPLTWPSIEPHNGGMKKRLSPEVRREALIDCALRVAALEGLAHLTRDRVAAEAGVSPALVSFYLGTMEELRQLTMSEAVKREVLPVIAEGLASHDPQAMTVPERTKRRALAGLISQ